VTFSLNYSSHFPRHIFMVLFYLTWLNFLHVPFITLAQLLCITLFFSQIALPLKQISISCGSSYAGDTCFRLVFNVDLSTTTEEVLARALNKQRNATGTLGGRHVVYYVSPTATWLVSPPHGGRLDHVKKRGAPVALLFLFCALVLASPFLLMWPIIGSPRKQIQRRV